MNMNDTITQIAKTHLDLDTLEERKRDSLDFHEHAVWQIKAALIAAYEAGRQAGKTNRNPRPPRSEP
jgi:hypothetical protein